MKLGLSTIRSKLLALVALPVLVALGALGALERVLEGQLLGEAQRHAMDARGALQASLDDSLRLLKVELAGLSESEPLARAMAARDAESIQRTLGKFSEVYPELVLIVADADGRVLVSTSPARLASLGEIPGLALPEGPGAIEKTLSLHGCGRGGAPATHPADDSEAAATRPVPARLLAARAGAAGIVVVCQRLDAPFLEHAAEPLGMKLALVDEHTGHHVLAHTDGFPLHALADRDGTALWEEDGELWAVADFCPRFFAEAGGDCTLDALGALPVTGIRRTVRADFLWVLVPLALAGLLALLWGGRVALTMNRALDRLVQGFRRLAVQDYAPVEPVRTGDELEELALGFNEAVAGLRERDHLKTTFGKYMTESVVSHLLNHQVELGGDKLPVTILFSDIRGFTSISEQLEAQELVALLNEYFTEMVDIVMDHGGVVDKYIGDAIMVIFGAPVPGANDALNAVRAALAMRESLARLNTRLEARGAQIIRTGIGIHSGEVIAGNIGSERRMEYTVIGDAVNLASRLESSTKDLGADLVISEATYALTRDHIVARPLGTISVKGREQPVDVYAVDGARAADAAG
jgi:adenylate cyclase